MWIFFTKSHTLLTLVFKTWWNSRHGGIANIINLIGPYTRIGILGILIGVSTLFVACAVTPATTTTPTITPIPTATATPTPVPTATPTPAPSSQEILDKSKLAMAAVASFTYDTVVTATISQSGSIVSVTGNTEGEFQAPDKSREVTTLFDETVEILSFGDRCYINDTYPEQTWVEETPCDAAPLFTEFLPGTIGLLDLGIETPPALHDSIYYIDTGEVTDLSSIKVTDFYKELFSEDDSFGAVNSYRAEYRVDSHSYRLLMIHITFNVSDPELPGAELTLIIGANVYTFNKASEAIVIPPVSAPVAPAPPAPVAPAPVAPAPRPAPGPMGVFDGTLVNSQNMTLDNFLSGWESIFDIRRLNEIATIHLYETYEAVGEPDGAVFMNVALSDEMNGASVEGTTIDWSYLECTDEALENLGQGNENPTPEYFLIDSVNATAEPVTFIWSHISFGSVYNTQGPWSAQLHPAPLPFKLAVINQSGECLNLVSVTASTPTPVSPPSANEITVSNHQFDPVNVTIKAGDTLTWHFTSGTHSSTSTGTESWDSGGMSNGTFSRTFNNPGTFQYHCKFHASMTGAIVVTE